MTTSKAARLACLCALFFGGVMAAGRPALAATAAATPASAPATTATAAAARQIPLEQYHLLALSPSEGVAVLRTPDRQLVTLRVGNTLPPARARLVQVLGDRLRFDTVDDKGTRGGAWMIRSADAEQLPQVQRVSLTPPPAPGVAAKGETTVVPLSAPAKSSNK
jgi:hypothetical protein